MNNHQKALFEAMEKPDFYPHPVNSVRRIDTHISAVFLTGDYVYKLKKSVDLGFLNFTELQDRQFFCEEELRINRRTAPEIYLDSIPIYLSENTYSLAQDEGEIVEYAVKMKQFDPELQLDLLLKRDAISQDQLDELASHIADLHSKAHIAQDDSDFGEPEVLLQPCLENFDQLEQATAENQKVTELKVWTLENWGNLKPLFKERKQQGFIRECHGDMHLANIAVIDNAVTLFDAIEFDDHLRWIDVGSDLAFLLMDLESHSRFDQATHVLNAYLNLTGDYDLIASLRFYKVYRALVRAKVAALQNLDESCHHYLELAQHYTVSRRPTLFITVGLSGAGKSWGSASLADKLGLYHVRSDIERKRLAGMQATDRATTGYQKGLYSQEMSTKTYQRLQDISTLILQASESLIIDATFIQAESRKPFEALARSCNANFVILYFKTETDQLKLNIKTRMQRDNDPSDADIKVLEKQLAVFEEPAPSDQVVEIAFRQELPFDKLAALLDTD